MLWGKSPKLGRLFCLLHHIYIEYIKQTFWETRKDGGNK